MSDGGQKRFRHSREEPAPECFSRGRNPLVSFEAKTLGPRLRGDDEIVVIDFLKAR